MHSSFVFADVADDVAHPIATPAYGAFNDRSVKLLAPAPGYLAGISYKDQRGRISGNISNWKTNKCAVNSRKKKEKPEQKQA